MVRNIGELWLLTALAFSLHSSRLSAIVCPDTTSQSLRVSDTDGATDLSAAVNCTGGTVNVVWVGLVTILGTIEVGQDTTLNIVGEVGDGGTGAVINGASSVRIFEVGTGATLQVENTTIRGGLADAAGGGGVRCSGASLILVDCVFESNESNGSGGGVWMEESTIIVTGGSFVRNTAAEGMGGAVHALDSNLTIDSVFFDGNRALNGGAIHVTGAELESWGRTICNLARSTLGNNVATAPLPLSHPDLVPSSYSMPGGGGVYIENATLDVIDCMLHNNSATSWGGALNSNRANVTVSGTNLRGNKAMHSGGAALVGDAIIDGGTTVIGNFAENYGGGIFQRDNCVMILGDVLFANNDGNLGGALFGDGVVKVLGGTVMNGTNIAHDKGGCIYARGSSIFSIYGGTFTGCNSEGNGGFLYASAGSVVEMFDGTVDSCLAKERAGVMYASGNQRGGPGANVTIRGGTYVNNTSLEHGGGFVAWGPTTTIVFAGGHIIDATTKFFGGFLFLEELASVNCTNTVVEGSYAGDEGGGVYAIGTSSIYWACDLIDNDALKGADMYLIQAREVHLVGGRIDHRRTMESSEALYLTGSNVFADGFSVVADAASETSIAMQMDTSSSFLAVDCVFATWRGESVIHNDGGELVLEGCDFSGSETKVVVSTSSTAVIRNAVVGDPTINAATDSMALVDNALTCSDANSCSPGVCLDGELGVYCQCYHSNVTGEEVCMNQGGNITMWVSKAPDKIIYRPATVEFTLMIHAEGGLAPVLWNISALSSDFNMLLYPSSGVLPPNSNLSVRVEAVPRMEIGRYLMMASFTAVGLIPRTEASVEVYTTYLLCEAYEYASFMNQSTANSRAVSSFSPVQRGESGIDGEDAVMCIQCAEIEGAEGVDCSTPGATLNSLPLRDGYWRATTKSLVIRECINSDACIGGTFVADSDGYCASGYMGPYCAVCKPGYGRSNGAMCHHCRGRVGVLIQVLGVLCFVLFVLSLMATGVFLVGGMEAVHSLHRSLKEKCSATLFFKLSNETHIPLEDNRTSSVDEIGTADGYKREELSTVGPRSRGRSLLKIWPVQLSSLNSRNDENEDVMAMSESSVSPSVDMRENDMLHELPIVGMPNDQDLQIPVARGGMASAQGEGERTRGKLGIGGVKVITGRLRRDTESPITIRLSWAGVKEKTAHIASKIPFNKVKIVIVVWQIISEFPSITNIFFPASYKKFLSVIHVVNLNLGSIVSASCLFVGINFYHRLLFMTLFPIILGCMLGITYAFAMRSLRHRKSAASQEERRKMLSRHVAFGLLLTFLVFSSVSTTVFQTFACDDFEELGVRYLRADYNIMCDTREHDFYKAYAVIMILVYPLGIPLLYFAILWKQRNKLDPKLDTTTYESTTSKECEQLAEDMSCRGQWVRTKQQEQIVEWELKERVRMRGWDPDLTPTMFLWKDFGPNLYYYEVIECGRRILLTGALIFIEPQSAAQAAMACLFAFLSLLGFELLRPHLDDGDSWLYRLGCIIIFLSNFLGLLIRVDVSEEESVNQEIFGVLLVIVNIAFLFAIWGTTYFSTQQMIDDTRSGDDLKDMAVMLGAKKTHTTFSHSVFPSEVYGGKRETEWTLPRTGSMVVPTLEIVDKEEAPQSQR